MNERIAGILGIARRAGRVQIGFDAVVGAIKTDKVKLVLLASDLSPKTDKEWRYAIRDKRVSALTLPLTKEELGNAFGLHKPVGLAATDDEGFAARLRSLTTEQQEE